MKPTNKFIEVLKEIREELSERIKMLRYYGVSGIAYRDNEKVKKLRNKKSINYSEYRNDPESEIKVLNVENSKIDRFRETNLSKFDLFKTQPLIAFICYTIPRKDTTSSEYRLFHILKILLELNCRIELIYCHKLWNEEKYKNEYHGNINYTHLTLDADEYENHILAINPEYLWISELWRLEYTSRK